MADVQTGQVWFGRGIYALIAVAIIFAQLLPLDATPGRWAPPDMLLAVTLVWVARRPDLAPWFLVAVIFFLTDLLFQRPPGLWAALVLILTEMIRKRSGDIRSTSMAMEWGTVAMGLVAITLANRFAMALTMTPQAPLGLVLIQMVLTILAYPVVAVVAHLAFGVRRRQPAGLGERA